MLNLLTKQIGSVALCAAAAALCEGTGTVLENKPAAKAVACTVAAVCSAFVTYETAQKSKKFIEVACPAVGKSLKQLGRYIKK
jgi:hypothetical protein